MTSYRGGIFITLAVIETNGQAANPGMKCAARKNFQSEKIKEALLPYKNLQKLSSVLLV